MMKVKVLFWYNVILNFIVFCFLVYWIDRILGFVDDINLIKIYIYNSVKLKRKVEDNCF